MQLDATIQHRASRVCIAAFASQARRYFLQVAIVIAFVFCLPALSQAQAPAPTNFIVWSGNAQALLSWNASAGAASYNVQRAFVNGGPYALLTNVAATTYTDNTASNGVHYYYVVSALSNSVAGANSLQAAAIPIADSYYRLVNRVSGLALDDPNGAGSGGVFQQPYSGTNQAWRLFPVGGGVFAVFSASGAALSGLTPSAQLTLSPFTSANYQFWTFRIASGTDYLVRNLNTSQVMDDFASSTNAGTAIGQWELNGGFNQHWALELLLPQLAAVAVTNAGPHAQYTFTGQVNPNGLETMLICHIGTNTSYGASATNVIPATNGPVSFSVTIPFMLDRVTTMHGLVTASNGFSSVSSGDVTTDSISFQAVPALDPVNACVAFGDLNDDGLLDVTVRGGDHGIVGHISFHRNPGNSSGTSWPDLWSISAAGAGVGGCLTAGDFDNDNIPDLFASGERDEFSFTVGSRIFFGHPVPPFGPWPYTPVLISTELGGAYSVVSDFDHSGRQALLLCSVEVNAMLRNVMATNPVYDLNFLQPLDSIVDIGPAYEGVDQHRGGWSLSGGFMSTNGFMDVFGFDPNGFYGDTSAPTGTFYRNDGEMGFTVTGGFQLPGGFANILYGGASSAWADFNGDGLDDIVICQSGFSVATNMIWLNIGNGNFTNSHWALPQLFDVNIGVGDLLNHGRNDLVMTGSGGGNGGPGSEEAFILRNDGNGVFTPTDFGLFRVVSPAVPGVAMGDYDNDGRLDFAIVGGQQALGYPLAPNSSTLYRNLLDIPSNVPPAAPGGLSSSVGPGRVDLSWGGATDDITPANGLTYNVRIGTNSLGTQTVSPLANVTNGWRKIAARGNVGPCLGTYWNLPLGTYFWSVQAVDGAYAGGAWAEEQTFTITAQERPVLNFNGTNLNRFIWPSRFISYQVEQATNLAGNIWATNDSAVLDTDNGKWRVTVSNAPSAPLFYRLRH